MAASPGAADELVAGEVDGGEAVERRGEGRHARVGERRALREIQLGQAAAAAMTASGDATVMRCDAMVASALKP
jgi:hypothetical protein